MKSLSEAARCDLCACFGALPFSGAVLAFLFSGGGGAFLRFLTPPFELAFL